MPKRQDIHSIMIIGSGPIVISQACEFDYSGTQACKALREEGFRIILINSNPATIMTDPEFADRTYIEPITADMVEKIIALERPDALLPTVGGQTGLNTAMDLSRRGVYEKYNVELIGATPHVIEKAENRELFKEAMKRINLKMPFSDYVNKLDGAYKVLEKIGRFPVIIRPSFTLGGIGGGIAYNIDEFKEICARGFEFSPVHEILVEESVIGWKEYELEVMRDKKDNVIIVCSIENFDPMGIHTGDSITVAPAQTLTDREYQAMRDAAKAVIREIGVETGGSNIQFAVNPESGELHVIEMNPRVSRSSALASKATGFPIAKFAAKLAVGYTLDEIQNDITKKTPACFEPAIDYCVVKVPRFTFEKFPKADPTLTTQMKSVGETMSIGRTFKEAFQKALRSLEIGRAGWGMDGKDLSFLSVEEISRNLTIPNKDRIFYIKAAFEQGMTVEEIYERTRIDRWFLQNMKDILGFMEELKKKKGSPENLSEEFWKKSKQMGFSDTQIAVNFGTDEDRIRHIRKQNGVVPTYRLVDTCAAEFEAFTPYYYSTYETTTEVRPSSKKKIMILGGGPNRIGQGIEFDYCCVHASFALREEGYETIMVNSNPETVSTDFDISDKLYFEPLTYEDVLNIYEAEGCDGAIVQLGGQTPLNLAQKLKKAGVKILGTDPDDIDASEDREKFQKLLKKHDLVQPPNGTAWSKEEAMTAAQKIGYPVVVRPSFVLGGRSMEIVYDDDMLKKYMTSAIEASPEHPILIDKFIEDAVEIDVDAVCDGETTVIGAIMEHIEEAGIHSGDSACVIPPFSLGEDIITRVKDYVYILARELNVRGLMNVQMAVKNDVIYVLEVNPRASRTVPFVSKSIGIPLAKIATKVMTGKMLKELGFTQSETPRFFCVKEAVLPFTRFPGSDILLGPEMRSTGEVMGIDRNFGAAFIKAQFGAGQFLPKKGTVFISVKNQDKRHVVFIAKKLKEMGFHIIATSGTAQVLRSSGMDVQKVCKLKEGRPHVLDYIKNHDIHLIINTPQGKGPKEDEELIRSTAVLNSIPCITTLSGASAAVNGIEYLNTQELTVISLQDYHKDRIKDISKNLKIGS
ncbi:MAG: carbamoyl-phosphate synthase large subunit [Candidatus Aureabacteria bacterium]|nr:carbamoyl-phosphate synthase large subunit [Candidatus Auribacterota bacterium]